MISKRAPIGYVARIANPSSFNQGCLAIVPDAKHLDARFLTWALSVRAIEMASLGKGTTFAEISAQDLMSLEVALPSLRIQHVVADYLDRETAQIDTLISEQERLITLLCQRRRSVVDHELGRFERTVALRRVASVTDCAHITADFVDEANNFPVASIRECQGRYVDLMDAKHTTQEFFDLLRSQGRCPQVGDLLFIRNVSVGLVSQVAAHCRQFAVGQETVLIHPKTGHDSAFVRLALGGSRAVDAVERAMIGSTFRRINVSAIRGLPIPVATVAEQREVAEVLDAALTRIDRSVEEAQKFVALARERRAALITAAVTGQLDIPGVG